MCSSFLSILFLWIRFRVYSNLNWLSVDTIKTIFKISPHSLINYAKYIFIIKKKSTNEFFDDSYKVIGELYKLLLLQTI